MGMDLAIYSARNHEVFKHDKWWDNPDVVEEFYGRKAWHYIDHCSFIPHNYFEEEKFLELSIENVEEMIKVGCEYRNYWNDYKDVPKLCELRDKMNEEDEDGERKYFLFCSY